MLFWLFGAAVLCMPLMMASLWIDETATYWLVENGARDAVQKTIQFSVLSSAYTPIAWAAVAVGGASEVALRFPSLASMAIAVYLFYRLAAHLFDGTTGTLAAVLFAYWPGVSLATLARPYAVAHLAIVAATLALVRWVDGGRRRHLVLYVFALTATMYLQPLYAPIIGIHVILASERRAPTFWPLVAAYAVVGTLALPEAWTLWSLRGGRAAASSFANVPSWIDVAPAIAALATLAGVLLQRRRRLPFDVPAMTLIAWTVGPLVLVVILSQATGLGLGLSRYYAYFLPGMMLTLAVLLRSMSSRARAAAIACVATIVCIDTLTHNGGFHEDWREGAARVRALRLPPDTPVLVRTGSPEARIWYRSPDRASYLLAPLSFYPVSGAPLVLPYDLDAVGIAYLEHDVVPAIRKKRDVVIFAHDYDFAHSRHLPLRHWFDEHLTGFTSTEVWRQGPLVVLRYKRQDRETG